MQLHVVKAVNWNKTKSSSKQHNLLSGLEKDIMILPRITMFVTFLSNMANQRRSLVGKSTLYLQIYFLA